MPYINVKIYEGRSVETKRAFVEAVTKACTEIPGSSPESVHIFFDEMGDEDLATGGVYPRPRKKKAENR